MAYSDYGGYAYLNGQRVEKRSDAMITETFESNPGMYPGFAAALQGMSSEQYHEERESSPHGHVVMGNAPVYAALYKQADVKVWFGNKQLTADALLACENNVPEEYIRESEHGRGIDVFQFMEDHDGDCPLLKFELPDNHTLYIRHVITDNYYTLARLDMPNGDVWTGFSGYGIGAGLENADYSYSTEDIATMLLHENWADMDNEPEITAAPATPS